VRPRRIAARPEISFPGKSGSSAACRDNCFRKEKGSRTTKRHAIEAEYLRDGSMTRTKKNFPADFVAEVAILFRESLAANYGRRR